MLGSRPQWRLLHRIAIPAAATGCVAVIWRQLGANIGPQRRNVSRLAHVAEISPNQGL